MKVVKSISKLLLIILLTSIGTIGFGQKSYDPNFRIKPIMINKDHLSNKKKTKFPIKKIKTPAYVSTLPLFCKIEHKMSKKANLPIKFRLGSVDYVDRLEGKK